MKNFSADQARRVLDKKIPNLTGLRVHRYDIPLDEGTEIEDLASQFIARIDRAGWLFFLDSDPLAFWEHPARLVLVPMDGSKPRTYPAMSWPEVAVEREPGLHWLLVSDDPKRRTAVNSPRRGKPTIPQKPPRKFVPREKCQEEVEPIRRGGGPKKQDCKKYALILKGNPKPPEWQGEPPSSVDVDMLDNVAGMTAALRTKGYLVGACLTWRDDVSEDRDIPRNFQRRSFVNLIDRLARDVKCCDEVIIYYTGHGTRKKATKKQMEDATDGKTHSLGIAGGVTATELAAQLAKLRSCHINVLLDCCYSGGFIKPLGRLAGVERVHTSSRYDEVSYGGDVDRVVLSNGQVVQDPSPRPGEKGSEFSSGYIQGIKGAPADATARELFDKGFDKAVENDVTAIAGRREPRRGTFTGQTHPTGISRAKDCDCNGPKGAPRFTDRQVCR